MPKPTSKYRWNPKAARYTLGGRFVKQSEIVSALNSALRSTAARVAGLAAQYKSGAISLMEWERLMREAVKDAHLYSMALARGGWAQMTSADYGTVGRIVRDQYVYLNKFAAELASGYPLDGRFAARAAMYMKTARSTYYDTWNDVQQSKGMTECRNVRHAADSCAGCIEESAQGWVPIEEMSLPGTRTCLSNCLCDLEYR